MRTKPYNEAQERDHQSAERELLSVSWLRLGEDRWSRVGDGPQASGRANKPGSDSVRTADQAFQFEADAFGVLWEDRQVEGLGEVAGAHRPALVGQGGEDLLVGGVVRDVGAVRPVAGGGIGRMRRVLRVMRHWHACMRPAQ